MPRFERNTERRGRGGDDAAAWPAWSSCSCPLTDLPGHVLALIADALALVGLRRTLLADDRGHLADGLLGDAAHDHAGGLRDLEVDSLGSVQLDRVRIAERQDELAALQLSAVADALDLQALLEAVGDALDHVRDQAAREPVQRAVLAAVGRSRHADLAVVLLDRDLARHALLELALGPLHLHELRLDRDFHPIGDGDRLSADARHVYQTLATSSPPTPSRRASWPVITPLEVETIMVPIPPWTLGTSVAATYWRRPGFDRRWMPRMTGLRLSVYFSLTRSVRPTRAGSTS